MRKTESVESWVVYTMAVQGKGSHANGVRHVVCEQAEWDVIEQDQSGKYTLVRAGITNESEAEKLARGTSGDAKARLSR
jgi:hypothetical protein